MGNDDKERFPTLSARSSATQVRIQYMHFNIQYHMTANPTPDHDPARACRTSMHRRSKWAHKGMNVMPSRPSQALTESRAAFQVTAPCVVLHHVLLRIPQPPERACINSSPAQTPRFILVQAPPGHLLTSSPRGQTNVNKQRAWMRGKPTPYYFPDGDGPKSSYDDTYIHHVGHR